MRLFLYTCCIVIVIGLIPAFVQDTIRAEASDPAPDAALVSRATEPPPSRVGRLSLVTGDVDLRGAGETSWAGAALNQPVITGQALRTGRGARGEDRKSTRLNSSHVEISYAVFCLKKKKKSHRTSSLIKKKKIEQTTT